MANYDTTTKVIINDLDQSADSVTGSLAKEVNDYFETVANTKTIRGFTMAAFGQKAIVIIVHDS